MKEKQTLVKFFSILFIVFASIKLLFAIILALATFGVLSSNELAYFEAMQGKTILVVSLVALLVELFLEYYLGFKGLAQLKGTYKGDGHIKASLALMTICAIYVVYIVVGLVTGTNSDWTSIISEVASIIIVYFYRDSCIKLKG